MTAASSTAGSSLELLATILSDDAFRPAEPASFEEAGLPGSIIEGLICKRLLLVGRRSGRQMAEEICLPFNLLDKVYRSLRSRQVIVHQGSAPLNDYVYALTDSGRQRANQEMANCAYVGPAPVPLMDYVLSAEAQTIRAEHPRESQMLSAFRDISVNTEMFDSLGPAINSGAGLFLYGQPGNGKSTLAQRITQCFGQAIWLPHAIYEDGQIIKVFDAAYHDPVDGNQSSILKDASHDRRWSRVRRPTVVVGGELTMDNLEVRHDSRSNVCEAPLQVKSNCGCLLIDDFGRQRIEPAQLLNRWIIPLENRVDYLTLPSGKKIQVPFEQLIIFSTNIEPADLVDEAFMRRIPYKVEIGDPNREEFHRLFQIYAAKFRCEYRPAVVDYLIDEHYVKPGRGMRRCHPRDLLNQIQSWCSYKEAPMEMTNSHFDRVVRSYFTLVIGAEGTRVQATRSDAKPTS